VGRLLGAFCLVVICLAARGSAAEDREDQGLKIEGMNTSVVVLASSTKPNYLDGKLIGSGIAQLRVTSPTFRDLLAVLAASPRLLTLISPSPELRSSEGMIGKTRFLVGPNRIVAFVDVFMDRTNHMLRQEAIAHELGHIVEVACLGPFEDQASLHRTLRRRAQWSGLLMKNAVIETAFAITIGRQVVQEAKSKARLTSQFMRLASESGLTACPVLPPGDGFTIVQRETSPAEGELFQDR
jgi:hypothetical protein